MLARIELVVVVAKLCTCSLHSMHTRSARILLLYCWNFVIVLCVVCRSNGLDVVCSRLIGLRYATRRRCFLVLVLCVPVFFHGRRSATSRNAAYG